MRKSKVVYVVTVLFLVCSLSLTAEEENVWWGSWYSPGNLSLSLRGAYEKQSGYMGGVGVYPGAEVIILKPDFKDVAPFDIGLAARGHFGIGFDDALDHSLTAGVGALAAFHLGFRGLEFIDPEVLARVDYFAELGLCLDLLRYDDSNSALGFAAFTGFNYYVNPNISFTAGYSQWGSLSGAFIGGQFRIGPSPEVRTLKIETPAGTMVAPGQAMMAQMYVAQFYAIYWYAFAAGGFYFDDSTYKEGDGTVWELTSSDDAEGLLLEKALLKEETDGSRWWRVAFTTDGDRYVYEYQIAPDYSLIQMYFKDVGENQVGSYSFKGDEGAQYGAAPVEPITPDDYGRYKTGSEKLTVRAGTFNTDVLKYELSGGEDRWSYSWWVSRNTPGSLVKFTWEMNNREEWMQGELVELTRGNVPELIR
jgi:hypothetical protein